MRMILVYLYVALSLICLKPLQLRGLYLKRHGRAEECRRITDKWVPRWMGSILKLAGIRVEVDGIENIPASPAVFVCNHQGMVDIPVLLSSLLRPRAMMSKAAIGKIPLLRGWMDLFDCQFVQRDDPQSARACYENSVRLVKAGGDMCIFPEGTRSKDGGIGPFKSGSFRIASAAGAPLVPMYLHGTRALLEDNGGWIKPGVVKLRIYPPVPTAGLNREELRALPDEIHALMDAGMRAETGMAKPAEAPDITNAADAADAAQSVPDAPQAPRHAAAKVSGTAAAAATDAAAAQTVDTAE